MVQLWMPPTSSQSEPAATTGRKSLSCNSGVHTVTSSQPVGVQVYGFGYCDAYGYFGGVVK